MRSSRLWHHAVARLDQWPTNIAAGFHRSFTVSSKLRLHLQNDKLSFSIEPIPNPYLKTYPEPDFPDEAVITTFIASLNGQPAGLIALSKDWTGYGLIEDIIVDNASRRTGVGTALLDAAKAWALSEALPGLRLETQDNNATACLLYAKAGFALKGFDQQLYAQSMGVENETALFWYWRPTPKTSIASTAAA